ncbi:MAG: Uncharacterised protein [Arcobacter lacus]|nr:MAG: Uncharacterised protein [Arcobacter lacus]
MAKILIHTTTLAEAKPLIDYFELTQSSQNTFINEKIVLIVSGLSKDLISNSLQNIFKSYEITKAFDLSVASCCDGSVKLGTLFCTNKFLKNINFAPITTLENYDEDTEIETIIADKQAKFFSDICKEKIEDYYVLKIVGDYFDEDITENKIFELIKNSINKWKDLI